MICEKEKDSYSIWDYLLIATGVSVVIGWIVIETLCAAFVVLRMHIPLD